MLEFELSKWWLVCRKWRIWFQDTVPHLVEPSLVNTREASRATAALAMTTETDAVSDVANFAQSHGEFRLPRRLPNVGYQRRHPQKRRRLQCWSSRLQRRSLQRWRREQPQNCHAIGKQFDWLAEMISYRLVWYPNYTNCPVSVLTESGGWLLDKWSAFFLSENPTIGLLKCMISATFWKKARYCLLWLSKWFAK